MLAEIASNAEASRESYSPIDHGAIAIDARAVSKSYGSFHAMGPFDLQVADGEFVCIVGPSGCGKSTFVRLVAGLANPTSGTIDVRLRGDSLTPIATVFQDFGIFPWKTVRANIEFGLVVQGMNRKEAREIGDDWLNRMGLRGFGDVYPDQLSGGMRQRVSIARALAVEPEILLMDEPFAALDAQLREIMQEELLALCQRAKRTVIFVTHSLDEAIVLADRVVVMTSRPGKILDATTVPFPRPRTAAVRDSVEFSSLRSKLWEHLRSEVQVRSDAQADDEVQS